MKISMIFCNKCSYKIDLMHIYSIVPIGNNQLSHKKSPFLFIPFVLFSFNQAETCGEKKLYLPFAG